MHISNGGQNRKLHRETAIIFSSTKRGCSGTAGDRLLVEAPLDKHILGHLKKSEKTRSQHIKRQPFVNVGPAGSNNQHYMQKGGGLDLNSQLAAIANGTTPND